MQDATRAEQCLARLCELTGEELLLQLWPVVLRMARLLHEFRSQAISPQSLFRFETELAGLLWEMGRRLVQWTLNQLECESADRLPRELLWDGDAYRIKRRSPTGNLNCLFGKIRVWRWLYEPSETPGLASLFPLQLRLGIVAGVATPALADRVARLAADLTQRQVLNVLRDPHQVRWGPETLRKVVAAVAEGMSPFRHAAQVALVSAWLRDAAGKFGPRRVILAVGRDGLMLPICGLKKYKEGAAATVSVYRRWGKRLGTVYLGQMPESGQETLTSELTRLLEDILQPWKGPPLRLVYITDAGFHPREYFEEVLSRMPDPLRPGYYLQWEWIVDYYHACQYITKLAEAIFGSGRQAHAWAAKMRRCLKEKESGVFRVLRSAGALRTIRGLVGEEEDYQGAYDYLRRHANSMDYRGCRRRRVPIGSGVTEAACKIVFTQRFKCAGMKWKIASGGAILTLRVIALSQIWANTREAMLNSYNKNQPRTPKYLNETNTEIPLQTVG